MKKLGVMILLALMLTGCAQKETFETVADEAAVSVSATPKQIYVALPEETSLPAMECDSGMIYFCRDFDMCMQTMDAGDLKKTVLAVSGFEPDQLTILKTQGASADRYDFTWSSAAERGEQVYRAAILDDGAFHYVLTVSADADQIKEYSEVWNGLFDSFSLD